MPAEDASAAGGEPQTGGPAAAGTPPQQQGLPPHLRHDLLNALNAINGYAALLQMDLPDGQPRVWAGRILQAAAEAIALAGRLPSAAMAGAAQPRRLLLVTGAATGDALELALDRLGWEMLRALDWAEAGALLADAPDAVDLVLADTGLDGAAPPGRDVVPFTAPEPSGVAALARELDRVLRGRALRDQALRGHASHGAEG